jgi:predicted Fe-Mo cluster-binding NifX family protein
MKIAVATMKGGLADEVSPVMGRCSTFTIVEIIGGRINETEVIKNEFANSTGGVGIQAAQQVSKLGVEVLIAGNFGPNAFGVLEQAGIKLVQAQGKVENAVMRYLNGELKALEGHTAAKFGGLKSPGNPMGGMDRRI